MAMRYLNNYYALLCTKIVVLHLLQTVNESYAYTSPCDFNDLAWKDYTYFKFNSYMQEALGIRRVQLDSDCG